MKADRLASLLLEELRRLSPELRELARKFTGVAENTLDEWVKGNHPPRGERLNKLLHFLATAKAAAAEDALDQLPEFGRYLGSLMAYGLASMEDAKSYCGLINEQGVLQVIRGQRSPAKAVALEELTGLYDEELEKAMLELASQVTTLRAPSARQTQPQAAPPARQAPAREAGVPGHVLAQIASSLGATLPLVRFVLDNCTDEERYQLRELLGDETLFELSNGVNKLSGVRAYNQGGGSA